MEGVSEEEAQEAARVLSTLLQRKRLLDVDVEVIIAEDSFIEPYKHDTRAPDAEDEALIVIKGGRAGRISPRDYTITTALREQNPHTYNHGFNSLTEDSRAERCVSDQCVVPPRMIYLLLKVAIPTRNPASR